MHKINGNVSDEDKAYILAALPIFLPTGTFGADIASRLELVEVSAILEGGFDGGAVGQPVWRVVYEITMGIGDAVRSFVSYLTDMKSRHGQLLRQLTWRVLCSPRFNVGRNMLLVSIRHRRRLNPALYRCSSATYLLHEDWKGKGNMSTGLTINYHSPATL